MKVIRRILKITGILLVLIVVALVAFVATFDANNYKPQIIEQVESATGRDFRIDGDIRLSIFPWVGIKVEDVSLGNDRGFKAKNLAAIKQLDVQVNVLPLLKKQVEINTIRLNGLALSLEVMKNGANNWSSLSQPAPAGADTGQTADVGPADAAPSGTPATQEVAADQEALLKSLKIEGFEFVDATIRYDDRSTGTLATVSELNLQTSAIAFDEPVDVSFGARVQSKQPKINIRLSLTTQLTFNREFSKFTLDDLVFTVLADAGVFLPQPEKIELKSSIKVLMDEQLVHLKSLELNALGLNLVAEIGISQFQSSPVIKGRLEVQPFNARQLAARAGVELPEMAGADALGRLAMKTRIKLAGERFEANDFEFKLDDSTLSGWLHVIDISKQQLRYDLAFDRLDINNYMPPVAEAEQGAAAPKAALAPAAAGAASTAATGDEKIELPLEMIRSLDIQGDFRIAQLTALEYQIKQFLMTLKARDGLITLKPVSMQLLGGQLKTDVSIDARKAIPAYAIKLNANQIQVGPVADPFLVGIMGDEELNMEGAVNLAMNIKTRGETVNQLKRASKGEIVLDMKQTRVKGFDPAYYMRTSVADYVAGRGLGQYDAIMGEYRPRQVTVFGLIRSNINLADGKARTDNFLMDSKRVRITAKGYVDIMANSLDMMTSIQLPRGKTALEKIFDEPMYVRVFGPFEAIEYKIDTDRLKKSTTDVLKKEAKVKLDAEKKRLQKKARAEQERLKQEARKKLEAEKRRLKEKADAERKRAEEKAKNKLKDKLRNLF